MSELVEKWGRQKQERINAEKWQALPEGAKYQNSRFNISKAHSTAPSLTRAGQQSHAGKNYWETGSEFNDAILEHVINNWADIYPSVIDIMKKRERESLRACQSFIDEMQDKINGAES